MGSRRPRSGGGASPCRTSYTGVGGAPALVCAAAVVRARDTRMAEPDQRRSAAGRDHGEPRGSRRRQWKGPRALCRHDDLRCVRRGRGTRSTQPVPARGSPRRISAGVTPAPERSDRRTATPAAISPRGSHGSGRASRAHHSPQPEAHSKTAAPGINASATVPRSNPTRAGQATSATNSASSGLGTSHSFAHLRHFRNAPRVLLLLASAPTYPHSGHVSATGLSQTTKSQFG